MWPPPPGAGAPQVNQRGLKHHAAPPPPGVLPLAQHTRGYCRTTGGAPPPLGGGHTHVHVRVLLNVAAHQVLIDVGENSLAHSLDVEARGINGRNAGCGDHEL